ncbi:MAG: hypothetical protein V1702_00040 [Candidatus Woesearchaeota archaeon]
MMRMQGAKRAVVVGALLAGLGFGGYAIFHNMGQGSKVAEEGYVSPNSVRIVKKDTGGGKVATFVEYNGKDIPLLAGETGVRLGDSLYIVSGLTQPERQQVFSDVWYKQKPDEQKETITEAIADYSTTSIEAILNQEQKTNLLKSQWTVASNDSRSALITEAWPKLEIKYRHGLVRQELDQLLVR